MTSAASALPVGGEGMRDSYLASLEGLVLTQNDTIAVLAHQLEQALATAPLPAAYGGTHMNNDGDGLINRVHKIECNISDLAKSLAPAIQRSIDARLPPSVAVPPSFDPEALTRDVTTLVQTQIDSFSASMTDILGNTVEPCIRKVCGALKQDIIDLKHEMDTRISGIGAVDWASVSRRLDALESRCVVRPSAAASGVSTPPEDKMLTPVDDDFEHDFTDYGSPRDWQIGDYVRLHRLRTDHLNDQVGEIVSFCYASGRFGVLIAGHSVAKAFKPGNLCAYVPQASDRCSSCSSWINLHAFPSCRCGEEKMIDSDGSACTSDRTAVPKGYDFHAARGNRDTNTPM